jgi:hypothetical protein
MGAIDLKKNEGYLFNKEWGPNDKVYFLHKLLEMGQEIQDDFDSF